MEILFTYIKISHSRRAFGATLPNDLKIITSSDIEKGFEMFNKNSSNNDYGLQCAPDFYI